jgi:hypothetical protein
MVLVRGTARRALSCPSNRIGSRIFTTANPGQIFDKPLIQKLQQASGRSRRGLSCAHPVACKLMQMVRWSMCIARASYSRAGREIGRMYHCPRLPFQSDQSRLSSSLNQCADDGIIALSLSPLNHGGRKNPATADRTGRPCP